MNKYLLILFLLVVAATHISASGHSPDSLKRKTKIYNGYSGGMFLHTGYLADRSNSAFSASGATFGIGGAVKINLGKHLRVGSEGYVSTMSLKNNGYIKMSWGGALADWCWHIKRFHPYIGLTVGAGSQKNFHMFEGSADDWEKEPYAVFHKKVFFATAPFFGCEFELTERFRISLKADYLLAFNKGRLSLPNGPRLYIGFIFGH